ncbi:membrane dipeptidase-domain-containing protein [Rhodofomes roseus]|uniref:Dipeptidase n=1 Tax=Rhodofomes roseus TaxID=34475 RepID=A0ABQ8K6R6_9APHY|nr:membrane dipeptidase-domain-containing protein [Rhodofomes roseus]KAH9832292.1 membrane dipeptidase-domain-containing protein [Rhodofomes roseus]
MATNGERDPLLGPPGEPNFARDTDLSEHAAKRAVERRAAVIRAVTHGVLTVAFVAALLSMFFLWDKVGRFAGALPKDPEKAAHRLLESAPVIDGHIDLPEFARSVYGNNITAFDLNTPTPGHVDIPRLKKGQVGGFFWSVFVNCPAHAGLDDGPDFLKATWRVRDTLEQIDVAKLLINRYPETFQLATTSDEVKSAIADGKIASLLGVEGAHQLGNSLAVLRQYHELGVRYVTLTHMCNNAFADSGGYLTPIETKWGGLSPLGYKLIEEMNRLGVIVDLSHTSDETARQALKHTKAPVIWSHSSARSVHNVARNVPDDILELVGTTDGKVDGVIMVNFAPQFVADEGKANVQVVADHVDHIANITGKAHVGLGSDYDGIESTPEGLEDVSKYPALVAELYSRGWNRFELAGLTGRNLLRVIAGVERVAANLQAHGVPPALDIYDKRTDLPKYEL